MATNRNTKGYAAWVKRALKECEPVCYRCGYPIDMTLPRNSPDGASVEHKNPLAEGGDLIPSMEDTALSHLRCNRQHGGIIGSRKSSASKPGTKTNRRTDFLDNDHLTPAAPALITPKGSETALEGTVQPKYHKDGFILPRLETGRHEAYRGSHGEQAAEWIKQAMGLELRGWQRYALERALEHDEDGQLLWPTVMITVGRQSGKSVLSRAICMWRLHHAELFGEQQTILHIANKRDTAMEVMRPAGLWATEKYGAKAVKWGNSASGITLPSGDRWLIHAANESAGVGYSISMYFADEAWAIKEEVIEGSITPTLLERKQAQGYLVSTAGDSTSQLMIKYRQRAMEKIGQENPGSILLLEWSAPPNADFENPETWKWASPEWSEKRAKFLEQQFESVNPDEFKRQYCNMWITKANHWLKTSWWQDTISEKQLPEVGMWNLAVESDFDGLGHAVAIAATDESGVIVFRCHTYRTIREVDEAITAIRAQHPSITLHVTPGYVDRIKAHIDGLVGQREAVPATQNLLDLFDRKGLAHDGNPMLLEQFATSTIARRQQGWVLSAPQGTSGVYAARAVMFAVAQASKSPRPVAMIRTRKRA